MSVDYSQAEKDRELIIRRRQRNTAQMFERMRKRIDDQISNMNMSTVSERVKRQQLEEIRHQLQKSLSSFYDHLEDGLKSDMVSIGESVLSDSEAFYKSLNMPLSMSIISFPVDVMENVINGTVYKEKWFLSEALWGDYQSKLGQINDIVTQGIGMNLSSLDIAKQLEQYVDPKAMKPSQAIVTKCLRDPVTGKLYSMDYVKRHPEKDWSNYTEKTSRYYYGKVDYNAQRLARTLVSHAYQQNVVRQAQANPFASGVRWEASGGERMCEICEERDGKIFPVDDVPLDHPNGMCTFAVETPSMMEMSNTLADWVNGEPTDWDDQLNAYYEGRPIQHRGIINAVASSLTKNTNEKAFDNIFDYNAKIDDNMSLAEKIQKAKENLVNNVLEIDDIAKIGASMLNDSGWNNLVSMMDNFSIENMKKIDELWDNGKFFANYLSKHVNFGYDDALANRFANHFMAGASPQSIKVIKEAYKYYPTSWISSSLDGTKLMTGNDKRGFYESIKTSAGSFAKLFIGGKGDDKLLVAIHELGHRMEDVVPFLSKYTHEFYEHRTSGEKSEWLGYGYKKDEYAKADGFIDPYFGKDYGNKNQHEILSMGYQYLYSMNYNDAREFIEKDKETASWLLGMTAILGGI